MKVSYRWLQSYVDIDIEARELADRLTMAGLTVDEVRALDEGLGGVQVGRIRSVERHPDADGLVVCRVEWGEGREAQVVTGAPNVQDGAVGAIVPFVPPGSALPDGTEIKSVELRGVRSDGMLCSERELGLGEDHSGILILPGETPPGVSLVEGLGLRDDVIEIDVYPNRPDCLGVIGVAREVAAVLGRPLRLPETPVQESDERVESAAGLDVAAGELCPRYSARVLKGVTIGPSPLWMQQRLRSVGMRPINNVVDVTNYVMWETGQPLHAFDYEKIAGRRVEVRRAEAGETMVTLDGKERALRPDMLVIADADRPIALAGVMGGLESEVTGGTRHILLESAVFDRGSVRRTSRSLGLRSEASNRFEKGLPVSGTVYTLERATSLLQQFAGAGVLRGRLDSLSGASDGAAGGERPRVVALRPERVNRLLGTEIDPVVMADLLRRVAFDVTEASPGGTSAGEAPTFRVAVPPHRQDVEREADLVEEIARLYGYDAIPPTLPRGAGAGGDSLNGRLTDAVRDSVVASGLSETISFSFIDPNNLRKLKLEEGDARRAAVAVRNPLAPEMSVMRTTLLPGLLEAAARNVHRQQERAWLYEIGTVFLSGEGADAAGGRPDERPACGLVMVGDAIRRSPHEPARNVDFFDVKGVLERLFESLGCRLDVRRPDAAEPFLHPGRAAVVTEPAASATAIGWCGELHPDVARAYDISGRVYAAELDLARLGAARTPRVTFQPLPRYPAIVRDLALLAPADVPARRIEDEIRAAAGELVQNVRLFDQYVGEQIPEGKKSLAYSITYQASDRTLTDDEVARLERRAADELQSKLHVSLRG